LLTPLAALLPTIEVGLGKDNNCATAIASMQAGAKEVTLTKIAKR
jgi:hypothetical protein